MPYVEKGYWQINLSYDNNYLGTLKDGGRTLEENSRVRTTRSILLQTSYQLNSHFSVSALISYVFQKREIRSIISQSTITDRVSGPGDAILLLTYHPDQLSSSSRDILIGAGPKIPLGSTAVSNLDGIVYNADLQPGSGSWDLVFWGMLNQNLSIRPGALISLRSIYRYNGQNPDYLAGSVYSFGNEWQLIGGVSDQLVAGKLLFDPSLLLRYRQTGEDMKDDFALPNTGGRWLFVVPGINLNITPAILLSLTTEIPVYSELNGTQLTIDYRYMVGIYWRPGLKRKQKEYFNI